MRVIDSDLEIGKEYWFDDVKDIKGKLVKIQKHTLYFEAENTRGYAKNKEGYVDFEICGDYFHTVDEK